MSKKNKNNKNIVNQPLSETDKLKLTQQELEALAAAKATGIISDSDRLAEDKVNEEKKEERNKKVRGWLKIIICVLIILLLLVRCSQLPLPENVKDIINMGFEDTVDKDELNKDKEEVPYDARESLLTISMNKVPVFANGQVDGNVNIINDERNVYYQFVEIYLDGEDGQPDETKLVYKSNLIDIGQALPYDSLDVNLPAGTYQATAFFNAVKPETMEAVGKAGAKIEITIISSEGETVDVNSDLTAIIEAAEAEAQAQAAAEANK